MPRTTVPHTTLAGSVNPISVKLDYVVGDVANGHAMASTGSDVIVVRNVSGGVTYDATVLSVEDAQGRLGDEVRSLAPSDEWFFGPIAAPGWKQADGMIWLDVEHSDLRVAVFRIQT